MEFSPTEYFVKNRPYKIIIIFDYINDELGKFYFKGTLPIASTCWKVLLNQKLL